jgi:uncharacterized RmlC-like cupin family protein
VQLKPVKHEHVVEISVSPEIQEKVAKTKAHMEENKKSYLFGLGGVAIGALGMRLFTRRSAVVQVVVQQVPTPE